MAKVPMVADGGELTTLRGLASDVYGRERVDWPEQMPDEVKPKIDDDHEFGYLYRLNRDVGRMGRRWVRADVSILAADFEDGKRTPIPGSGFSDFETVLDEASARVSGEALFQKEITRSGLGPLVPFRDFTVGDVWPVLVWDLIILEVVVSRIEATSEVGAATDWRVLMGNELVSDYAAQQRANESAARAVEQSRRQARSEARRQAEAVRSYADSAVAVERVERRADVDSVRGEIARLPTSADLNREIEGLNERISALGGGESEARAQLQRDLAARISDLNNDLDLLKQQEINDLQGKWNTQQETINDQNAKFRDMQVEITARQVQTNLLQEYMTEYNRIMAEAYRAHQVTFELKLYDGKLVRFESNSSSSDVKLFSDWPEIKVTPTALHIDLRAIGYEFHTVLRLTHTTEKDSVDEIVLSGPYTTMGRAPQLVIRRPDEFPITETGRYEVDASGLIFPSIVFPEYREKISALKIEFREKGLRI